jgi:F0F1-type ATP synthase assembly protein I
MAPSRQSDANMLRTAWELSAGLLSFVIAIAIGWWFGGVLDRRLGTAPWLTDVFTAFGLAAGVLNVYRTVSRAMRPSTSAGQTPPQGPGGDSGGG